MRHFYYTIQTLMHERGTNIIKILSLTLGIFVGILLFSCVAFQLNYYDFCPKPEQLYIAYVNKPGSPDTYGTLAGAIRENFPKEVKENSDFLFDIVASMSKQWNNERAGWGFDASYTSIIRFRNPVEEVKEVEARMLEMLKKYLPVSNNL